MLHLEGLPNAEGLVDIVCYEEEKIQSVTEEWMMSCGVSLFTHWGNTCTHHTSHHDHIRSYYSCHGIAGASPFRHAICTTRVPLNAAYSQTMRSATLRALSLWPQLSPEQLLHPPPGDNILAYDSHHSVA